MRGHFSRQNATQRHRKRQRQFLCCMTALVSLLLLPLTGCASQEVTRECFAMDTVMTLSAYGDHAETALADVETELYRLDRLFSISSSTGDIAKLNRSGSATVSNEPGNGGCAGYHPLSRLSAVGLLFRRFSSAGLQSDTDYITDCRSEPLPPEGHFRHLR